MSKCDIKPFENRAEIPVSRKKKYKVIKAPSLSNLFEILKTGKSTSPKKNFRATDLQRNVEGRNRIM